MINPKQDTDKSSENIISIDPAQIKNWELHDRLETELGDIEALAKELKEYGQQQPCIVRLCNDSSYKYELIAGERRWRAALLAEIKLKVVIKKLSDTEASIIQIAENSNRKDISEYAKGINYARLIERKIVTRETLMSILNINKTSLSRLLSFNEIPQELIDAIKDMSKVSARTASTLVALCKKGQEYLNILKANAPL